jgi:hypothetical protein
MHLSPDDDFPTDEEHMRIGWESGKSIGWEEPEMAEYDSYDEHCASSC